MPHFGVREVKSAIMKKVAELHVLEILNEGIRPRPTTGGRDAVSKWLEESSIISARNLQTLMANDTTDPDELKFSEIIARSLSGNGANIDMEVLTQNNGNERLKKLQKRLLDAIPETLL